MNNLKPAVSVCIVTHDSADDLPQCLAAVGRMSYRPLDLVLVDCASHDSTREILREDQPAHLETQVIELTTNLGFSGGMNRAIEASTSPFILVLNPDATPRVDFVDRLVARILASESARPGAISGRLLRPEEISGVRKLDACGMRLVPTWRHLDRGSGVVDTGQWTEPQRVFGATAAAALYSREALEDVALQGEFFATEFHSYREDAELCFRLRERNWEVLYEPDAVCTHRRRNHPNARRSMPAEVNFHSFKNRYLIRAYHQDLPNLLLTLVPTLWRDLLALIWVVLRERTSLKAYSWLWKNRQLIAERRRWIQGRKQCRSRDLNRWFFIESLPL